MTFKELEKQINSNKIDFSPIYFFFGEELYFIDKLTDLLEVKVLQGAEKSFNLDIVYGPDTNSSSLIALLKTYPTMAQKRLIILKEAHRMKKDEQNKLAAYLQKPVKSSVLVIIHNTKQKPDGRTAFGKTVITAGITFESKPLYENQVESWINEYVHSRSFSIAPEATQIIAANLGNNLHLLENELKKIFIYLQGNSLKEIDKNIVYEFVNIDKDYNVFELINNIGARKVKLSHTIINQMMRNTKDNPPIAMLSQLFSFFTKLAILNQANCRTEQEIANALKINPYFAQNYQIALKNYSLPKIQSNIYTIQEADLSLKGITPTRMGESAIMKTLIYKLLQ